MLRIGLQCVNWPSSVSNTSALTSPPLVRSFLYATSMFLRTLSLLDNIIAETPSIRMTPRLTRQHLLTVLHSPYKESFKDYWATPIPFQPREFGRKPSPDEPVPLRLGGTMILAGRNNHIDPAKVESGEDNDYKVLMNFREARGRYVKDMFIFPSYPVHLEDLNADWAKLLQRLGVTTAHEDLPQRIAAIRALLSEANMLVLPPDGGQLAEVQGPPGGLKRWHMIVMSFPGQLRNLLDILEIPYEDALKSLLPFRRIQTPTSESFRYDNTAYVVPFHKLPCVRYNTSVIGEKLIWVSPREALARYNAGVMEMPTPNLMLMSELDTHLPRWEMLSDALKYSDQPDPILPELVHNEETRMATVLLPGDIHHTESETRLAGGEAIEPRLRRFQYIKDDPYGVRAYFFDRPVNENDDLTALPRVPAKVVNMATRTGTEADDIADRSAEYSPSYEPQQQPKLALIDDAEFTQINQESLIQSKKRSAEQEKARKVEHSKTDTSSD